MKLNRGWKGIFAQWWFIETKAITGTEGASQIKTTQQKQDRKCRSVQNLSIYPYETILYQIC